MSFASGFRDLVSGPKMSDNKTASKKKQMTLGFGNEGQLSTKEPLTNPQSKDDPARKPLAEVASEMIRCLPGILLTRPDAEPRGILCERGDAPKLDPKHCPNVSPTAIRVVNSDTIDAAIDLMSTSPAPKPVCILNMANATIAGGGWKHGALAQEEALFYRTSLSATLRHRYYPLPDEGGIYSPRVLVIRESMKNGHNFMDMTDPKNWPIISVVSVAAICQPDTKVDSGGGQRYKFGADAKLMEEKMRVILRMAVKNGHRQIILGAFGCGVFGNPREEVARMWRNVLTEPEFQGGWWQDVVFAVLDDGRGIGNFGEFWQRLDGVHV